VYDGARFGPFQQLGGRPAGLLAVRPTAALVEMRKQLVDRLFGLPPLPAKPHQGRVDDDAMQPCREARISLEVGDRLEGRDEGFLDRVARVVLAAEHAACDGEHATTMSRTTLSKATSSPRRNAVTRPCSSLVGVASLAAAARRISSTNAEQPTTIAPSRANAWTARPQRRR
jgi:hypothetical protein